MLRVLIVDDEPIVRQGLKCLIDWEEYGFTICGEASDGSDGLNKLLELKPDLAMVDIKMPNIDGIEMVRKAKERGYTGNVFVLTGYSEMQYAQYAIRIGVDAFLLKPIEENDLIEELLHLKMKLKVNARQTADALYSGTAQLREKLLADAVCGIMPEGTKETALLSYLDNAEDSAFRIVIIEGLLSETANYDQVRKLLQDEKNTVVTFVDESTVILVGGGNLSRLENLLQRIGKTVLSPKEPPMFTAVGREFSALDGIAESYRDAKRIIERRFYLEEEKHLVFWEELCKQPLYDADITDIGFASRVTDLYVYIEIGNEAGIKSVMKQMEENSRCVDAKPEKICVVFVSIYLKIKEMLATHYKLISDSMLDEFEIIAAVYKINSLQGISKYICDEFVKVAKQVGNTAHEHIVKRVRLYIENNYSKELRLGGLADIFGYNSAYLGQVFLADTGTTFNAYLDKVRIGKAKELLLNSDLKVYEVSEQVGYKNIDYFYRKFKTVVGMSPKEFIKSAGSEQLTRIPNEEPFGTQTQA